MDLLFSVLEFVPNQILIILLSGLILGYARHFKKGREVQQNEVRLIKIDLESLEYAVEKSIGNGFSALRLARKKELLEDNKLVNN